MFFKDSLRYSQVKVHHRYQRHRWQILQLVPQLLLIPVENFANGVNNTGIDKGGKLPPVTAETLK
jgi:hypothetical protein